MEDYPEENIGDQRVIPMRWLLRDRPVKGIKARMVVQDVNRGGHQDTFAASPTTLGQRLLMRMSVVNGWGLAVGDALIFQKSSRKVETLLGGRWPF